MEQELTEAVRLREQDRQQWSEQAGRADAQLTALRSSLEALERERTDVATQEQELVSLREEKLVTQEALEKEKRDVTRLEAELALMKENELTAARARSDASERDKEEISRLANELASLREVESAAVHTSRDALEQEESEIDRLEKELKSLRDEQEDMQKKTEILAEMWRRLRPLAPETLSEETSVPADPSLLLGTIESIETQLAELKGECSERNEQCSHLRQSMESLQGMSFHLGYCVNVKVLSSVWKY